jgi:hypothetical protein
MDEAFDTTIEILNASTETLTTEKVQSAWKARSWNSPTQRLGEKPCSSQVVVVVTDTKHIRDIGEMEVSRHRMVLMMERRNI